MDYKELRDVMKFLFCKGLVAKDIHADMSETLGDAAPSFAMVKKWVAEFRKGRLSTEDSARTGRPKDVTTLENAESIRKLIKEDQRVTVKDLSRNVGISSGSIHGVITNLLEFAKVSGRWVSRRMTNEQRLSRVEFSEKILSFKSLPTNAFLFQTVVDYSWVYHLERTSGDDTEETDGAESSSRENGKSSKSQETAQPPKKKKKIDPETDKVFILFWDEQGIVYSSELKKLDSKNYKDILLRVRSAYFQSRPASRVHLLQDVAREAPAPKSFRLHIAPKDSPDLSPSDYLIFPRIKEHIIRSKRPIDEPMISLVQSYLFSLDRDFFSSSVEEFARRCDQCTISGGDYIEK